MIPDYLTGSIQETPTTRARRSLNYRRAYSRLTSPQKSIVRESGCRHQYISPWRLPWYEWKGGFGHRVSNGWVLRRFMT